MWFFFYSVELLEILNIFTKTQIFDISNIKTKYVFEPISPDNNYYE